MPEFKKAKVVKVENPASTFHVITLETEEHEFQFEPGQFIAIKVDDRDIRDYSIASLPDGNRMELIVDIKPGHEGSYFVHNLQEGDVLEFMGPMGNFKLKMDDGAEEMVFLGTGSGIAPLKSMVEQLLFRIHEQRPIKLYFGLRFCGDIFLHEYFDDMAIRFSNFTFVPCLSKPDDSWRRDCGHITELVKGDYQDGSKLAVYICGNPKMIEESVELAKQIGVPENRIYHEAFG